MSLALITPGNDLIKQFEGERERRYK